MQASQSHVLLQQGWKSILPQGTGHASLHSNIRNQGKLISFAPPRVLVSSLNLPLLPMPTPHFNIFFFQPGPDLGLAKTLASDPQTKYVPNDHIYGNGNKCET